MSQVLAPCLELFRCLAGALTEHREGMSKAVWIKTRQFNRLECLLEDCADGACIAPMLACQATDLELAIRTMLDLRRWK
jgi:hypothetical protein